MRKGETEANRKDETMTEITITERADAAACALRRLITTGSRLPEDLIATAAQGGAASANVILPLIREDLAIPETLLSGAILAAPHAAEMVRSALVGAGREVPDDLAAAASREPWTAIFGLRADNVKEYAREIKDRRWDH